MQLKFICFFFFKKPLNQSTFVAGAGGGVSLVLEGKEGPSPSKARTQEGGFCHLPQAGLRAVSREQLHAGDKA